MPRLKHIILFLIILTMLGIAFYFYFNYEKPLQDVLSNSYQNLSISAYNDHDGRQISIDYIIYLNGTEYSNGKTSETGSILNKVPIDNNFKVITNDKNKEYYDYLSPEYMSIEGDVKRILLYPKQYGNLEITHFGNIPINKKEGSNLTILLSSTGYVSELEICVKWSYNFLDVKLNLTSVENPNLYFGYDKCYYLGNINNQNKLINLDYTIYNNLTLSDSIELVFIDQQQGIRGTYSDKNGKDIGIENKKYILLSN